jgi:hypothetical protein
MNESAFFKRCVSHNAFPIKIFPIRIKIIHGSHHLFEIFTRIVLFSQHFINLLQTNLSIFIFSIYMKERFYIEI